MGRQGKNQQQLGSFKRRVVLFFVVFAAFYLLLGGRLVYLQAAEHRYYQDQADKYLYSSTVLPAHRGLIYDRNGDLLVGNEPACNVEANRALIPESSRLSIATTLSPILHINVASLVNTLTFHSMKHRYVFVARNLAPADGAAIKAANLQGILVENTNKRVYPNGILAAQILGFTDQDGNGAQGVELSQNTLLAGHDGREVAEIDKSGRFLPGTDRVFNQPVSGSDIYLTIDRSLQEAAETELLKTVTDHHAQTGCVVIMDPRDGEILAMASYPTYDPNQPIPRTLKDPKAAAAYTSHWLNVGATTLYEPGSTMKTITLSAVLQDEGLQMMTRIVDCTGVLVVDGHTIHCAPDPPYYGVHGRENLRGILKESCNIGMAMFGMQLGQDKLYAMEQQMGFLEAPNSGLPYEHRCHLQSPYKLNKFTGHVGWSKIQTANIAFGQGIAVTPLQLTRAYCVIANGGTLVQPHIIRAISNGAVMTPTPVATGTTVLKPDVAAMVRSCLGTVVKEGTGEPAQIAGFDVGGKTGSAQVAGGHGYEAGKYVGSFIGMLPLSKPHLVILCSVFNPQGVHWGAVVAAPVVHDLAKLATRQMHLTPDDPAAIDWDNHLTAKRKTGVQTTLASGQTGQITQL